MAVAPSPFNVMDRDFFAREIRLPLGQSQHNVIAQVVYALAVRPDFKVASIPSRHRTRRSNGGVGQIGFEKCCFKTFARLVGLSCPVGLTLLKGHRGLVFGLAQKLGQIVLRGQLLW